MKIQKLEIQNFLSFSKAELNLADNGLVLIQGVNKDEETADSNGSGKSTIPDSLSWCLYDTTCKGVSGDDIINRKVKKDCKVSVTILKDEDVYVITRYRQDTENGNRLILTINGKDETLGTNKETQNLLVKKLGVTENIFNTVVYCGQDSLPKLPTMTDKEIKKLIEKTANISCLDKAYELAREKKNQFEASISGATENIKRLVLQGRSNHANKMTAIIMRKKWMADRDVRHKAIEDEIITLGEKAKEQSAKYEVVKRKNLRVKIINKDVQSQLESIEEKKQEIDLLRNEVNSIATRIEIAKSEFNRNKIEVDKIKEQIENIKSGEDGNCPSCGRRYEEEDIQNTIDRLEARKEEIRTNALKVKEDAGKFLLEHNEKNLLLQEKVKNMPDAVNLLNQKRQLEIDLQEEENIRKECNSIIEQMKNKKTALQNECLEGTPYDVQIVKMAESTKHFMAEAKKAKEIHVKDLERLKIHENVAEIYSPSGVRANIIDNITPFLNLKTQQYLHILSGGSITAKWNTLSITKAGVIKEKFNIEVAMKNGGHSFKALSGGEKRKVMLACAMALQDLAASRTNGTFDIWIGDEIDDALDSSGLENLMNLLSQKAKEKGTVLIISHNNLKDWIGSTYTVVKENDESTLRV